MLKVPNGCTRRSYLFTSFEVEATMRCARWIKKSNECWMTRVGSSQLVREDGTSAGRWREVTARFSSSAFVQGEFVDNVPRLLARIINHLFPMNWRTVRAGRLQGTLILRRTETTCFSNTALSRDKKRDHILIWYSFNLNKRGAHLPNKYRRQDEL